MAARVPAATRQRSCRSRRVATSGGHGARMCVVAGTRVTSHFQPCRSYRHHPQAWSDTCPRCRRHRRAAYARAVLARMIGLPAGTRIWIAAGITDMRAGFNGLAAKVQMALEDDPFFGHVFVFRGRRGNVLKVLWSSGDGLCLLSKRLERGRFVWPQATSGKVHLTPAQLSMLLEGICWCRRAFDPGRRF